MNASTSTAPRPERSRLGDILVDYGILTPEGVRAALARQRASGARFGEAVVELGLAKANDLLWALSEQSGVSATVLGAAMVDRAAVRLLGEEFLRRAFMLPVAMDEETITLAADDPLAAAALEEAGRRAGRAPKLLLASPEALREAMAEALDGARPEREEAPPAEAPEPARVAWLGDLSAAGALAGLRPGAAVLFHGPSRAANARVALALLAEERDAPARRAVWVSQAAAEDAARAGFSVLAPEEARAGAGRGAALTYADGARDGETLAVLADWASEGAAALAGVAVLDPDLARGWLAVRAPGLLERAVAVVAVAPLRAGAGPVAAVVSRGFLPAKALRRALRSWTRALGAREAPADPALAAFLERG